MSEPTTQLGRKGERLAARFLKKHGYRLLQRNYTCPRGEIDLVALDGEEVVFVEVRTRTDDAFGDPAESVTSKKRRQVSSVALDYARRKKLADQPMRFDVVTVLFGRSDQPRIELFRDAFPFDAPSRR